MPLFYSPDSKSIANLFNNHFTSIAKNIEQKIIPDYLKNLCQQTFLLTPTIEQEVLKSIKLLKRNKASGPFSFPIKFLKQFQKELSKSICLIINLSFSTGTFTKNSQSNLLLQKRGPFALYQLMTSLFTFKPEQNNRNTCS